MSVSSTLLAVAFGFATALCACSSASIIRKLILASAIITLALPPFLVTNSWLHFLGHTGVWHSWLHFNIVSPAGAIWILTLMTWPITMFLVWAVWQQIEPAQLEADPAVTGSVLVRGILWPVAGRPLALAGALTFVLNLNNFSVPAILQLKVLPDEVWIRFNTLFDAIGALRLSLPLILAPLALIFWIGFRPMQWPRVEKTISAALFRTQLGRALFGVSALLTLALAALGAVLPVIQLLTVKRTWIEFPSALAAGQSAVWNSAWLSAVTALIILSATLLPLLIFNARRNTAMERGQPCPRFFKSSPSDARTRLSALRTVFLNRFNSFNLFNLFNSALWLPFLIPGVLLGIALIGIFNRPRLFFIYESSAIVILALSVRFIAIASTSIAHARNSLDRDLLDSADLCGASRWRTFRQIIWPQIAPRILATWYILFLFCLWDVETTILIMPPGLETMSFRIFNLLHYGHNSQINALCLILLILALLPLILWTICVLIRDFRFHATRNTQYAIRRSLMLCGMLSSVLILSSCSRPPPNSSSLHSDLFSYVQVIGSRGVGVGQLNKPRSVAIDLSDNLFVIDMSGRVQKFAPDGHFLLLWQMPQTDLGKPKGMCRDRKGNILLVEPHYQRVNEFSPDGKLVLQWGTRGTNHGQFILPRAVGVNSHNEIFISEYEANERVQRFSPTGKYISEFGRPGNGPGEFNRPEGLCVDSEDRIYVADSCNHRIEIFAPDGKFIRAHGKAGKGPGELSYPYDICVDKAGRQYVAEFGSGRIQIFDANDKPLEIIGEPGYEPGKFQNPWGVALDSAGDLYVADSQNHRVQKLMRKKTER